MDHVQKVEYKQNIKARGLAKGHSGNITLLFTTGVNSAFYDDYFSKIVKGIKDVADSMLEMKNAT